MFFSPLAGQTFQYQYQYEWIVRYEFGFTISPQ